MECVGSEKIDLPRHKLIQLTPESRILICDEPKCNVLYFNFETKKWIYRPGFKNEALKTSKD